MNRGLKALEEKVLGAGVCTACGACVSLCPYLRFFRGRVVKLHDCDLPEGRCFAYCPRTEVDLDALHRHVFGFPYQRVEMGPVRRVWMARARDPFWKERAQTGGVVSALIDLALRKGMIQRSKWSSSRPSRSCSGSKKRASARKRMPARGCS